MLSAPAANILVGQQGQLCILVVEDEFLIRWMVSDTLREAGYAVIEAVNGDEALQIIEGGVHIDLVFSDVKMPGSMDGLALLKMIKQATPDLPVLVTSGHSDPTAAMSGGAAGFVRKPYDMPSVVALIAAELGGRDACSF